MSAYAACEHIGREAVKILFDDINTVYRSELIYSHFASSDNGEAVA